jgi:exonuclease VII small subunit
MCYLPDLKTIKKSLLSYVDDIKELSEVIDRIDKNELKLRDSDRQRLLILFEKEED